MLWHLPRRMRDAEIPLLSASLAFSTLLCLVPFLAVGFAVFNFVTGFEAISAEVQKYILDFFKGTAGPEASVVMQKTLTRVSQKSWTTTSAIILFLTSLRIFYSLELAINRIWLSKERRPFLNRLGIVLGFYFLIPFGLAVWVGLRSADQLKPIFLWNPVLWDILLMFGLLFLINRWMPSQKVRGWAATAGALLSAVGLVALGQSFKFITKQIFNYSKIYGSLAALPILCLGILLTWQVILFGVAFAASLQNPTARRRV